MNIKNTKKLFEEHDVVALKADKDKNPGVDDLLRKLGNSATAIPYYAIYSPGWDKPVHFGGTVLTGGRVKEIIDEAIKAAEQKAAAELEAAEQQAAEQQASTNSKTRG